MQIILGILTASWEIFQQSAIYMLFGFFIAGMLYAFVKTEKISHYLGKGKVRSVFLAAAIGIPLPLCSCGVVPAAAGLKKQGANKGATLSFLISTPETGADSIPITYALMDPIMTIMRPVAAFITAIVAGITENYFGKSDDQPFPEKSRLSNTVSGCATQNMPFQTLNPGSVAVRMMAGLKYAFGELLGDIGPWFVFGVLLAGLISYIVPDNFADSFLGNQFLAMLVMLIAGIPMYVCATSSTPIAAALVLKGLSPGAALVFLLAGPATNIASLSMVTQFLGKRSLVIYLGAISLCALTLGFFTDMLYLKLGISARAVVGQAAEIFPLSVEIAAAVLLAGLIGFGVFKGTPKVESCTCSCTSN